MSRRSGVWFRRDRNMFFTTHDGVQTPLGVRGPDNDRQRRAAEDALAALLASVVNRNPAVVVPPTRTVAQVAADFLARAAVKHAAGKMRPNTLAGYRLALNPFVVAFGLRSLESLTGEDVEDWAASRGWSSSTQNTYLGVVQTLLRWAKVTCPIKRPPKESRGAAVCLSSEQFAVVLRECDRGNYPGDFRALLLLLWETGLRPGEASGLTTESVDWTAGVVRLREHKTRRHTGADSVRPVSDVALALLSAQRDRYGSGLLYRTRYGGKFRASVIVRRCGELSERVGFRVIAYGCRHSFATAALVNGVPDVMVAGLLGHTGTGMLARHYSHVTANARAMRDAAERARGKAG